MSAAPPSPARAALLDHPLLRDGRLWQAGSLGRCQSRTFSSGFAALDAELPGGGWPSQSLCEILQPAGQHAEWRLLAPALRRLFAAAPAGELPGDPTGADTLGRCAPDGRTQGGRAKGSGSNGSSASRSGSGSSHFNGSSSSSMPPILLIAPPFVPHGPGLLDLGLEAAQWVWIKTTPEPEGAGAGDIGTGSLLGQGGQRLGEPQEMHLEMHLGMRQGVHQGVRQGAHQGAQHRAGQRASEGVHQGTRQETRQGPLRDVHPGAQQGTQQAAPQGAPDGPLVEWRETLHEAQRQRMPSGVQQAALQRSQQSAHLNSHLNSPRSPQLGSQRGSPPNSQRGSPLNPQASSRQNPPQGGLRGRSPIRSPKAQQALHQALWVAEQAIKSQAAGAVLVWLDGAQPEQIRRLQAAALNSPVPIFLMRPDSAATQSSAAPLRLRLSQPAASRGLAPGLLEVLLIKRRGPAMIQPLQLHSLPPRLQQSLPARLRQGVAPLQPAVLPAARTTARTTAQTVAQTVAQTAAQTSAPTSTQKYAELPSHATEPAWPQQAKGPLSSLTRSSTPEVET